MYKLHNNSITGEPVSVTKTNEDGSVLCIPFAPDNTDYQAFLLWKSEGNEPLPADE